MSSRCSDNVAVVKASNLEIEDQISIDLVNCSELSNQMECEMAGCMWHEMDNGMSHCMTDHNHDHDMGDGFYQPHDIAVDNTNGYWFTTAMMGTKVAMYSVQDNELLATYNTSAMPALLSVDEVNQKVYVSGGNPSMGETNKILELEYNENSLELVEEWDVQFSYAHGLHFDEFSGYVFSVSKTVDFISRFNPNEVQIPQYPTFSITSHTAKVMEIIEREFSDHHGTMDKFNFATNHDQVSDLLDFFLESKLHNFGDYEDLVTQIDNILFHSTLSPYLLTLIRI